MTKTQNWLIYMLFSTIIWSFFPIISGISLKNIPPFFLLTLATFFAGITFFIIIFFQKKLHEFRNIQAWKYALFASILIGVFHYGFYFYGLRFTTPGNAAIIAQTELVFSFFLFQMKKKESLTWKHIGGIILIILGTINILLPSWGVFQIGDILIIIAMMFAPLGNFYQKLGSRDMSASTFLCMRSAISCVLLIALSAAFGESWSIPDIGSSMKYIILNGAIIFGINKILWVESIRHVTVTRALAISGLAPLFTLFFVWIFGGGAPTFVQLFSVIPMIAGVYFLSK